MHFEEGYQKYVNIQLRERKNPASIVIFEDFIQNKDLLQKYCSEQLARASVKSFGASLSQSNAFETDNEDSSMSPDEAATKIQRAWRRHIDVQVFKYYRDLVSFKCQGDPNLLLRCINPKEASLIDTAFGGYVKFRLAGTTFPPNIYYKIFTHRPVQDLCANSPKDYTRAEAKMVDARQRNNKTAQPKPPTQRKEGWYQRVENNGWRLVSERIIANLMVDNVTWETSKKTVQFHHNSQQRKEDVLLKKKKKKIDWMRKMYEQGMLKCRPLDGVNVLEAEKLVEGAARGMLRTVDAYGIDSVEDGEVDELLEWTTALNFEHYQMEWKELATSASSNQKNNELTYLNDSSPSLPMSSQSSHPRTAGNKSNPRSGFSHNTPVSRIGDDVILELEEEGTNASLVKPKPAT